MLEVRKLSKNFGGLVAVNSLDFNVGRGEIVGLIGPNGAGKTTVFNLISGVINPSSGKVLLNGEDITGKPPETIVKKRIVRTFQHTTLFSDMSVLDNVVMGFYLESKMNFAGFWGALFNTRHKHSEQNTIRTKALDILEFLGLAAMKNEVGKSLAYGYQRTLGVAIALAANPQVLLLDEPITGMNAEEMMAMMDYIKRIRDERAITIVMVEHHMKAVMALCDRIVVLNYGKKIAEGPPAGIRENREVIEAYLGAGEENAA